MPRRSLKVKCPTWDHVEAFYQRKLSDGNRLRMKVPFVGERGEELTLALRLPDDMVMAIDARIVGAQPHGSGSAIDMLLFGMTPEVLGRLEALVADGRDRESHVRPAVPSASAPPPVPSPKPPPIPPPIPASISAAVPAAARVTPPPPLPSDAPVDELVEPPPEVDPATLSEIERDVFVELDAELRRLHECGAHEVLGVPWDASVHSIRSSYFALTKRFHPDTFAVYRSRAIQHLAQEVFIHINRAYDRMRDAAVAAGKAIVAGPALLPHQGWLAEFDDMHTGEQPPRVAEPRPDLEPATSPISTVRFAPAADGEQLFAEPPAHAPGPPPEPVPSMERLQEQVTGKVRRAALLEDQAHERFAAEDWDGACEALAGALQLDPRNRRVRGLYHTARGKKLLAEGNTMQATSQFEAAIAHDPGCEPAHKAIESLRSKLPKRGLFKRFFR